MREYRMLKLPYHGVSLRQQLLPRVLINQIKQKNETFHGLNQANEANNETFEQITNYFLLIKSTLRLQVESL